jgi:hypothetical protein
VVVNRQASSTGCIAALSNGASAYNCTFVNTGGTVTNGIAGNYATSAITNCGIFGSTTVKGGSSTFNFTTCFTDVSGHGLSGVTTTAYSTSSGAQFENITDGTHDFRIKTGSSLKDAGTTDSTNAAADISGTARPQGSNYDSGAWESSAAAAPSLSSVTVASIASTSATVGATTDTASGTLYCVVTASSTQPSIAQIKAGQTESGSAATYASSQSITTTGAKTFSATGLTSGLTYYAHFVHNATGGDSNRLSSSAIYPGTWRPTSDVTVTGWSVTGAASHAAAVNENTASDSEYSTASGLTSTATVKILALDRSLPAGTYTVKVRPKLSAGSGFVKITLMDSSNVSQGASADTAITSSFTTYPITVTTTGAATRIKEEYWI